MECDLHLQLLASRKPRCCVSLHLCTARGLLPAHPVPVAAKTTAAASGISYSREKHPKRGKNSISWCIGISNLKYRTDSKVTSMERTQPPRNSPTLHCTQHKCPIRVHWHSKANSKEYWKVKITITNLNYWTNYTQWTLAAQHPNLNNNGRVYSFECPLNPYGSISKEIATKLRQNLFLP